MRIVAGNIALYCDLSCLSLCFSLVAKALHNGKHYKCYCKSNGEKKRFSIRRKTAEKMRTVEWNLIYFLKRFLNKDLGKLFFFHSPSNSPNLHGNYFNKCFWFLHVRDERRGYLRSSYWIRLGNKLISFVLLWLLEVLQSRRFRR